MNDAKELTNLINSLIDKKLAQTIGPGWAYGTVTTVTTGTDAAATRCDVQLDGLSSTVYGCVCLEHVLPHVGDHVLTIPVNGFAGDRVVVSVTKSAYVPGQIMTLQIAELTPSWSQAVTGGSWYIPGISVTYTPPVNCWGVLWLDCWMKHSTGTCYMRSRIQRTAPSSAAEGYGAAEEETADKYWNVPVHRPLNYVMSAGSTYTFELWCQWGNSGTGTVYGDGDCTKLSLLVWKVVY